MKNKQKYSILIGSIILGLFCYNSANAIVFNPNNIISDEEMLDSSAMSLSEISAFLKQKDGYISKMKFPDAFGQSRSAAEIIFNAAVNNYDCENSDDYKKWTDAQKKVYCKPAQVNPKILLVLLQKEQSLLDHKAPSQKKLDWATGYGVCDSCSMSDPSIQRFKGFGKQINSAALQFYDYVTNPRDYGFKVGETYNISNTNKPNTIVRPENNATAGLYNYTPHVYNGNYNFFKLWNKYFTFSYTNGTLMQIKGEVGVWLIQDGVRRPFLTKGALTSRFDPNKIVQVNKSDLEKYPIGAAIKFPQYSLVRSPRGTVFLIIDDIRRGFASGEALRKIGINPEEIIDAEWEDINAYEEGIPITASSTYPTGALLQDNKTGGIYFVSEGTKAPLWDAILLKTKFKYKSITPVAPEKLSSYKTVDPVMYQDGELLKNKDSAAVYIIDNNKKRLIVSGELFMALGYKWDNIIPVSKKMLDFYPNGEALAKMYSEEEIEIKDTNFDLASGTTDTLNEDIYNSSNTEDALQSEIDDILNP